MRLPLSHCDSVPAVRVGAQVPETIAAVWDDATSRRPDRFPPGPSAQPGCGPINGVWRESFTRTSPCPSTAPALPEHGTGVIECAQLEWSPLGGTRVHRRSGAQSLDTRHAPVGQFSIVHFAPAAQVIAQPPPEQLPMEHVAPAGQSMRQPPASQFAISQATPRAHANEHPPPLQSSIAQDDPSEQVMSQFPPHSPILHSEPSPQMVVQPPRVQSSAQVERLWHVVEQPPPQRRSHSAPALQK